MTSHRVCFVVTNLDAGGLEKVVLSLIRGLDRPRFETYLICLDGRGRLFAEAEVAPGKVLVLHKSRARRFGPVHVDWRALVAIRCFIRQHQIDLIHAHNAAPLIYAGIASRTLCHRPRFVYSEHNQIYSASAASKRKFKIYARLADAFVAVSEDLARTLRRELGTLDMLEVIPNGIDGERFRDMDGSAVRSELGILDSDYVIGTGVVLSKQKGVSFLIDAAVDVVARFPRALFVVAGDGPLLSELKALAKSRGLGDRFRFLGYRKDMPQILAAVDLYVLPSLWEGMPLALLEALAMGKPIVCTAVGGSPEVVVDGETGYVVPPGDSGALATALLRVAEGVDFASGVKERNRARFEQFFSEQAMASAHERMFERMLQGRP